MTHPSVPAPSRPLPDLEAPTVTLLGLPFAHIAHFDRMAPFFMTLVSPSDHWLFLSSTGGLSAGRVDAERALFPYYPEDKLTENSANTGPALLLRVDGERWEPFAAHADPAAPVERHLYKSLLGHVVVFEERHLDWGLRYRAAWRTGERFGFVHSAWLENEGREARDVEWLGGLQNVLPAGATPLLTRELSPLLDAYKRSELDPATGLGVFALSATLTDRAEPSESLRATTVWSLGHGGAALLGSGALGDFRRGEQPAPRHELRGERGAYFVQARRTLAPGEETSWHFVADVHQDGADVADLRAWLAETPPAQQLAALDADLHQSTAELEALLGRVDGLQLGADPLATGRHLANALFNTMRGGLFASGYAVDRDDLSEFIHERSRAVARRHAGFLAGLPPSLNVEDLRERARAVGDPDLTRLCTGYLPLSFSRRHGDPSRPWNRFSIRLRGPDGRRVLDYQGNWRDLFQNWEALALSYPAYLPGMVATFLNATTADGYNPYRVTRRGLEWEEPEPDNPWANIGYWSDHQVIYLCKLLELWRALRPGELEIGLDERQYSHARVPYELRPYAEMLRDWSQTIRFDAALSRELHAREAEEGSDARLLRGPGGVLHVSLAEKLLTLLLAKLVNLVPGGGLWMNTQRPEWNDANNALVGKGLSVVTVAYLHRFLGVLDTLFAAQPTLTLTTEVAGYLTAVRRAYAEFGDARGCAGDPLRRRAFMDRLGEAGSAYREALYRRGVSGGWAQVPARDVQELFGQARAHLGEILRAARRGDGLYHAYHVLRLEGGGAQVDPLPVMLEGQVAALSSGFLSPKEALEVLRALRHSDLYRPDQHSYLLYPDRELPSFFEKNAVPAAEVENLRLTGLLEKRGDRRVLRRSRAGTYHFGGDLHNAGDLHRALDDLAADPALRGAVEEARVPLGELFERTFEHARFTGRSGTFFAYEGLGSIYWHMVSKLLLAAQEQVLAAADGGSAPAILHGLRAAYDDIRAGLSYNRSAREYGAFPTDPYSHTPAGRGAQQPGMTGQVKEELLTRPAELGVRWGGGRLHFDPTLLRREELLREPGEFRFLDVGGAWQVRPVPAGFLALTVCQVPLLVGTGPKPGVRVSWKDHEDHTPELSLPLDAARSLFAREGRLEQLTVTFAPEEAP